MRQRGVQRRDGGQIVMKRKRRRLRQSARRSGLKKRKRDERIVCPLQKQRPNTCTNTHTRALELIGVERDQREERGRGGGGAAKRLWAEAHHQHAD